MVIKDFHTEIMEAISGLTDIGSINRKANRVIGLFNSIIDSKTDTEKALASGVAQTGYTWDPTTMELTIPTKIKAISEIWAKETSTGKRTKFTFTDSDFLEDSDNDEENVYMFVKREVIRFAANNAIVGDASYDIEITGKFIVPKLDKTSTAIDIPEQWEEFFIAGTIMHFTVSGKFENKELYALNKRIYEALLPEIEKWEDKREPEITVNLKYNYYQPGE